MRFRQSVAEFGAVLGFLNWLLCVVEPLIVLALVFLAGYTAYWLVFGPDPGGGQKRSVELLKQLSDNWKAVILLLVVLFYRTIRTFFEQAEEAWGVKRKRRLPGEIESGRAAPSPPSDH